MDGSAALVQQGNDKYQKLQGRGYGGHKYLIYVLKHKQMLQDSKVYSTTPSVYSDDGDY